jgi:predicted small integral membrane protein
MSTSTIALLFILCRFVAALCLIVGCIGLYEASRWAAVKSDRLENFQMGAALILLGLVLWYVTER